MLARFFHNPQILGLVLVDNPRRVRGKHGASFLVADHACGGGPRSLRLTDRAPSPRPLLRFMVGPKD